MNWRNNVDPLIRSHLERQIAESVRHRKAYNLSESPSNSQLWIAIANLSKSIFDINLKLNYLERALKDIAGKRTKSVTRVRKK